MHCFWSRRFRTEFILNKNMWLRFPVHRSKDTQPGIIKDYQLCFHLKATRELDKRQYSVGLEWAHLSASSEPAWGFMKVFLELLVNSTGTNEPRNCIHGPNTKAPNHHPVSLLATSPCASFPRHVSIHTQKLPDSLAHPFSLLSWHAPGPMSTGPAAHHTPADLAWCLNQSSQHT